MTTKRPQESPRQKKKPSEGESARKPREFLSPPPQMGSTTRLWDSWRQVKKLGNLPTRLRIAFRPTVVRNSILPVQVIWYELVPIPQAKVRLNKN